MKSKEAKKTHGDKDLAKKDNRKKKRGGKPLILSLLLAATAGLLFFLDTLSLSLGFGGWGGWDRIIGRPAQSSQSDSPGQGQGQGPAQQPSPPAEQVRPALTIEVGEDRIFYDGREVSPEQLESIIQEHNSPEYIWELRDNQAIKAVYDEVKSILARHGAVFAEF